MAQGSLPPGSFVISHRRFQAQGVELVIVVLPYMEDQGPEQTEDRRFVVEQLRSALWPVLGIRTRAGSTTYW